jgi:hypothetical protein
MRLIECMIMLWSTGSRNVEQAQHLKHHLVAAPVSREECIDVIGIGVDACGRPLGFVIGVLP